MGTHHKTGIGLAEIDAGRVEVGPLMESISDDPGRQQRADLLEGSASLIVSQLYLGGERLHMSGINKTSRIQTYGSVRRQTHRSGIIWELERSNV